MLSDFFSLLFILSCVYLCLLRVAIKISDIGERTTSDYTELSGLGTCPTRTSFFLCDEVINCGFILNTGSIVSMLHFKKNTFHSSHCICSSEREHLEWAGQIVEWFGAWNEKQLLRQRGILRISG